ncbi:hypothetical protein [Helcococcus kunzii]|uniref:hypothetical protein n=1 Tax=Helcococcus kunzii TaxID=40091 RepID=UPI0038A4DC2C
MKRLVKTLVFNLILILIILYTGNILREKWEYNDGQYKTRYQMMRDDFNNNDIKSIFLGSSGAFTAINQTKIFEETEVPTVNLAHLLQSPFTSYHLFEDFIKENEGVEVLFLDILGLTREVTPNNHERETRFYNALVSIKDKEKYLNELKAEFDKDFRISYYMPILKYHDRWNRLKSQDFFEIDEVNTITSYQLTKVADINYEDGYMKEDKDFKKSDIGEKYLMKILDLAKSNDIDVVFYILPKMDYSLNEIEEYHKFAQRHNAPIIDFTSDQLFKQVGIDIKTDFADTIHLNYEGGKKISKYFSNYIVENYPHLQTDISQSTRDIFEREIRIIKAKYEKQQ